MKNYIFILFTFLISTLVFSQEQPFTIEQKQVDGGIKFNCENHSDVTYTVTLKLLEHKNIKGYSEAVSKRVSPGKKRMLLEIETKKGYSYKYQTSSKRTPTPVEKAVFEEKKASHSLTDLSTISEGIVVFDKSRCPRCSYATNYLMDKGIDFRILDVSEDGENNRLMWKLVRESGYTSDEPILTPVFLVNGELTHTHKDLKEFLEGL